MPAVHAIVGPSVRDVETAAPLPTATQTRGFNVALARARATTSVDPSHTPLGGDEAASALSTAYESVTGQAPTAKQLSLLVAQWSLETGSGRAMMNYNFGGIKGSGPSGLSTAYTTKEGYGATEKTIVDRFRAYGSAAEGATDYLKTLRGHFPQSFDAVKTGNATSFAHSLKCEGYYTGSEVDYTRAIESISSRAIDKGFASLGQVSGHATVTPNVAPPGADDDPMRALDAMSMADHMSRAAMQILGKSEDSADNDTFAAFARGSTSSTRGTR